MTATDELTTDAFLGGRLRLRQLRRGHRAGYDAVLLAAATLARPGDRVVDFGAGVGAAGLALASRVAGLDLVLVEIDPQLAGLAADNAAANALPARIAVLDLTAPAAQFDAAGLPPDSADLILTNPPFNDASRHRASPDARRSLAHQAAETTLEKWVHAARRVLKPGGTLTLIWRADAIGAVLAALEKGFGDIGVLPLHPDPVSPAIRVIVTAIKGSRAPLRLHRGLSLNDSSGTMDPAVQAVLTGAATLPLIPNG